MEEQKKMEMEIVVEDRKEMVPARYTDIISGEFAYDPVRLPLEQDPTQVLYNRKTLETIWETERHARNPFTRQWFDIKSAIPQTELRNEMKHFIKLRKLPGKTVISEYSIILDEGEMKRHLKKLRKCVEERQITEIQQWVKIWKKMNILRLFFEFHFQNIKTFISQDGFGYLYNVIQKILPENEANETALDVGKEIVRSIDVIINGVVSRGENSIGILGSFGESPMARQHIIDILSHVYDNSEGYIKIRSLILRAFSIILDAIAVENGRRIRTVPIGLKCALDTLDDERRAIDISIEDLNHGIAILRRVDLPLLRVNQFYVRAVCNAVIISISREIERSNLEMSGAQLVEAQMQARHNSEALGKGVRLIRDIVTEERQLEASILEEFLDIVEELLYMFERFTLTQNDNEVGNRCVHCSIAQDGLDISEAISKQGGTVLDVEVFRKFINDQN